MPPTLHSKMEMTSICEFYDTENASATKHI
jgi:hypothetical protein